MGGADPWKAMRLAMWHGAGKAAHAKCVKVGQAQTEM